MISSIKKLFFIQLLLIGSFIYFIPSASAVGDICANDATCCTAPKIIEAVGGCPDDASGNPTYWIGSASGGACLSSSVTCAATQFNCSTGACTPLPSGPSICPSGQVHVGGGVCYEPLQVLRQNVADKFYQLFRGEFLGTLVYLPDGASCSDGQVVGWNDTTKLWECASGGVWRSFGASPTKIHYSNLTNNAQVAINTQDPLTYALNVNGDTNVTGNLTIGGGITVAGDKSGLTAKYVGLTASVDGNFGGYSKAAESCDGSFPGSHVCTSQEVISSYERNLMGAVTGMAWVNNGAPGYSKTLSNDCSGWSTNDIATYGSVINFDRPSPFLSDSFYIQPCEFSFPFACCQ